MAADKNKSELVSYQQKPMNEFYRMKTNCGENVKIVAARVVEVQQIWAKDLSSIPVSYLIPGS